VSTSKPQSNLLGRGSILTIGFLFFAISTGTSAARWANFEYRTFDVAYYVQALWQLIRWRFEVSVQGVPLLGNHVEPIILLFTPLFAVFPHTLLFVTVQNLAIASMGPVAFDIGKRLGLERKAAFLLACAILITPATGYIALHEFHPEALAAPFILLMLHARLRNAHRAYWGWLLATLACKENMALVIIAYCGVHLVLERRLSVAYLRSWYLWPMALSIIWFVACIKLITPAFNSGEIDFFALYDRLGNSIGNILLNAIKEPDRILGALSQSLTQGNLLWATLLPFLALPLIRPRWFLIATPILLQHLLSWRSSEWTIYFHYAAPILPLFWFGSVEGVAEINRRFSIQPGIQRLILPLLMIVACVAAQVCLGPVPSIVETIASWTNDSEIRARKQAFISQVPPDASVVAPLPYLTHLATREKLYSLHFVLKGLKTLSRSTYEPPPPTDFVLIDYNDPITFDPIAGYYHPAMKTVDGRVIPSSDQLLHEFLTRAAWTVHSSDEFTTFRQNETDQQRNAFVPEPGEVAVMGSVKLTKITKSSDILTDSKLEVATGWDFRNPRADFPWMFLRLMSRDRKRAFTISRGLCGVEATEGPYQEQWFVTPPNWIPDGDYEAEALFVNNAKRVWETKSARPDLSASLLAPAIPLGELHVASDKSKTAGK
jgi:uncharacterized membrane protein